MEDESVKVRQRYDTIISLIDGDSTSLELLKELIDSAKRYVGHLGKIQKQRDDSKKRLMDREDSFSLRFTDENFSNMMFQLDSTRSIYHETLASNLIIFNRYLCKNYPSAPVGGMCLLPNEVKELRYVSAEWAKSLVTCIEK